MVFLALLLLGLANSLPLFQPEQIHISWGNEETSMYVSWASILPSYGSKVQYTQIKNPNQITNSYTSEVEGTWVSYPNNDVHFFTRTLFSCHAELKDLSPGEFYQYRVGDDLSGWSKPFVFQAKKPDLGQPRKFIVYGDMGIEPETTSTVDALKAETKNYEYDAIIHAGDMAYELSDTLGAKGDEFMNMIQPFASRVPYMVAQGNHESWEMDNTSQYKYRFKMPGNSTNFWYSFNAGKAHFIAFSAEFVIQGKPELQQEQLEFIKNDLKNLDRQKYPWVVMYTHRPIYCSASKKGLLGAHWKRSNKDCLKSAPTVRASFEDIFYENKVDLLLSGHVHAYERLGPAYENSSMGCEEESQNLCVNARAPASIVSGIPGQSESYAPVSPTPLPWSKSQNTIKGYGRLTVFNSTHLLWEQVSSQDQKVLDYLWLIKK